jgi:hypothetical protein
MDKEPTSEDQPRAPEHEGAPRDSDADDATAGFREPLGDNAVERLRRYQVMTIPPDARAAFLSAKLPGASPELLYDTLPPKAGVEHPGGAPELPQEEPWFAAEPAEHLANGTGPSESGPEEVAPPEGAAPSERQLRTVAVIGGILFLAAVLLAWIAFNRDREIQRAIGTHPTIPQGDAPVIVVQPRAAAAAPLAAAPEATAVAGTSEPATPSAVTVPRTEKKSETGWPEAPKGAQPVAAPAHPTEPAVLPPATSAASSPVAPPAASTSASGKKFRLGSR